MSAHYFIAIPLSLVLKDHFASWQTQLKKQLNYKQWTNKQDLHITLKFLGAVENEKLLRIQQELKKMEKLQRFSTQAGSIGFFGNPVSPRVLWASVEKTAQLSLLHQQVEAIIAPLGFPTEKRTFRPHITFAKKWYGPPASDSVETTLNRFTERQELLVKEIVIYQIFPKQTPKYKVLSRYNLLGGEDDSAVN